MARRLAARLPGAHTVAHTACNSGSGDLVPLAAVDTHTRMHVLPPDLRGGRGKEIHLMDLMRLTLLHTACAAEVGVNFSSHPRALGLLGVCLHTSLCGSGTKPGLPGRLCVD